MPVKRVKKRPPRIYRRGKKVYYVKEGNQRVPVSDVDLVINNIISTARAKRRPLGQEAAARLSKVAIEKEELKKRAEIADIILRNKEERESTALRVKQIRELAQAKTDLETKALQVGHEAENKQAAALREIENAQTKLEIENVKNTALKRELEIQQAYQVVANPVEAKRDDAAAARIMESLDLRTGQILEAKDALLASKIAREKQDAKSKVFAEQVKAANVKKLANYNKLIDEYNELIDIYKEDTKPKVKNPNKVTGGISSAATRKLRALEKKVAEDTRTEQMEDVLLADNILTRPQPSRQLQDAEQVLSEQVPPMSQLSEQVPPMSQLSASAAAEPEQKQLVPLSTQFTPPVQTGTGKKPVSSLPNGLTETQLNDLMDDEPRFLKTVAADEIPLLNHAAKIIDDDYGEFGFIINLDKRDENKYEHWISCYIDTTNDKSVKYYDPFGDPPNETITAGIKSLVHSLNLPYYLLFTYNKDKQQNLNSNRCGIHSMLFLRKQFADDDTAQNERDAMDYQRMLMGTGEPKVKEQKTYV